jgi:hypothetical protein
MEQMLSYCNIYLQFTSNNRNRAKIVITGDGIIDNYVLV